MTIQRDIGFNTVVDVAYVGNFDRHAMENIELNPVPLGAYSNPANIYNNTEINSNLVRTVYPGLTGLTYRSYSNSSLNYHALQTQAQHRLSHGLAFGLSYTFSKALGTQGVDNYHKTRQWYYGPTAEDRTHNLAAYYSYTLPVPAALWKPAKSVLGGWTLSGITRFTTGAPANPSCGSTAGFPFSDPSLTGGGSRCQMVADPQSFTHDFDHNFNLSAFTLAPIGTFGNTGLNTLRQPSWSNWDVALDKKVSIRERLALRVRFQAFNVVNHAEFNSIGTSSSVNAAGAQLSTSYGRYTGTQPSRQMAFTARLEF